MCCDHDYHSLQFTVTVCHRGVSYTLESIFKDMIDNINTLGEYCRLVGGKVIY